jgi:hypothetical protein
MKKNLIYASAIALILSVFSFSHVEATSNGQPTQKGASECCCQYETYDYLKDGTKKFRAYCYTWTTPERCSKNFTDAKGKVVSKPKDECKCVVPK